jgi:hypothetical protein
VFPGDKSVMVFLLQKDGRFDKGTLYEYEQGKIPVAIFKGFKINMKKLFEE